MAEERIKWYSHHLGHGFMVCEDPLGDVLQQSGRTEPYHCTAGSRLLRLVPRWATSFAGCAHG